MIRVGIRELRQRASELIRAVREDGIEVEITHHGKAVAMLIPLDRSRSEAYDAERWDRLDRLAARIDALWPEGVTAADALAEERLKRGVIRLEISDAADDFDQEQNG